VAAGKSAPKPPIVIKRPPRSLVELAAGPIDPGTRRRARSVMRRLLKKYPDARVMLNYRNPWELMVATILAAQCTDAKVNEVTPALFRQFGTPRKMAGANLRTLQKLIRPTGFFRMKSKSVRGASRAIVERFGGEVPDTMADLLTLPGLGRKTANVILGNVFGKAEGVVVDTHNIRLSNLLGFVDTKDPVEIERFWTAALDRKNWTMCGHVLYAHGQRVCVARRPKHDACVVCDLCPSADL
jgi:endonuclease-3